MRQPTTGSSVLATKTSSNAPVTNSDALVTSSNARSYVRSFLLRP